MLYSGVSNLKRVSYYKQFLSERDEIYLKNWIYNSKNEAKWVKIGAVYKL